MQQQLPPKSNLIRQTETAKKKARRKLIGSIFLLFVALIILLNVTARVKPIPVNPETIEIKNTASALAVNTQAVQPVAAPVAMPKLTSSITLNQTRIVPQEKIASSATIKVGIISKDISSTPTIESKNTFDLSTIKPIIISDVIKHKPTPNEILEGKSEVTSKPVYFILLISLMDKNSAIDIRHQLLDNDISTNIQSSIANKKPIYRLKIGPFINKDIAEKRLTEIKNKLGSDN